jgi:hypothetical protein
MTLIAGFLGIGQNPETGALRPCLGWVTALPKKPNILVNYIYRLSIKIFQKFISNILFLV